MKTTLEQLRDLLAGHADDQAVEKIRKELSDPTSRCSMFFAGVKGVAEQRLTVDWADLAEEVMKLEAEAMHSDADFPLLTLEMGVPSPHNKETTRLEQVRDLLAGRILDALPNLPTILTEDIRVQSSSHVEPDSVSALPPSLAPPKAIGKLENASDEELVAVFANQQPDEDIHAAFKEIWRRYRDRVYWVVFRLARNRELAEEAVLETFARLFKAIHGGKLGEVSNLWRFLRTVARYSLIDHHRMASRNREATSLPDVEDLKSGVEEAADEAAKREQIQQMQEAIGRLSTELRSLIQLRYYDQLSVQEIAERLGVSRKSVYAMLGEAKKQLRKQLRKQLQDGDLD